MFLVYRFHGKIAYRLKKYIQRNFNLFSKNWCNFHIDQSKGTLVKRQLKMVGMVQKKLYRTTLKAPIK